MTLAIDAVIHGLTDLAGNSPPGHDSSQRKSFRLCLLAEERLRSPRRKISPLAILVATNTNHQALIPIDAGFSFA